MRLRQSDLLDKPRPLVGYYCRHLIADFEIVILFKEGPEVIKICCRQIV